MARFHIAKEGVPEFPIMKGYKMACCDCGLVHDIDFTVIKKQYNDDGSYTYEEIHDPTMGVMLVAKRNTKSTGQKRRKRG